MSTVDVVSWTPIDNVSISTVDVALNVRVRFELYPSSWGILSDIRSWIYCYIMIIRFRIYCCVLDFPTRLL